ncbi:serine hydrolase domain-containing protein [Actinacidiphila guanduensis]|uniref:Beta-lactamase n=1 Tax=Actinacidiphila guanduensis TaxID=310781 RepID=A0A1H0HQE4_9ACTN|nr:serine hydrolase domain-containing protein [Actinacidiphila guanduensis]SDO21349.1 CubicO group peptidase, beta-lactamase class C family [Actinacidiphila guanduensis]
MSAPAPAAYGSDGLAARLDRALGQVRAPDVVVAASRDGRRAYAAGGAGPVPAVPRELLAYELGSLSKTFTVLLLADLARSGVLGLDDPLAAHLPVRLPPGDTRRVTLRHLATHTSGLPRVPRDLLAGALLRPYANGYAGYGRDRLLASFAGARLRHPPGTRWHYSNFGLALLGPALEEAAGAPYAELLDRRVLGPLGLTATAVGTAATERATGYRGDGRTPLPPTDMAAFAPAGGVVATPADVLAYAEAHLSPGSGGGLAGALRDVQQPQLRRGPRRRRETHTLTWYQHPAPGGPLLFHAGATFGQQCFLGLHPATRTAVAAFATRHDRMSAVVKSGYELLSALTAEQRVTAESGSAAA